MPQRQHYRAQRETDLLAAVRAQLAPAAGSIGCNAVFSTAIGVPGALLPELVSLPLGATGHRLVALRYLIANASAWLAHFAWEGPLTRSAPDGPARLRALLDRIEEARARVDVERAHALSIEGRASMPFVSGQVVAAGRAVALETHHEAGHSQRQQVG